MNNKPKRAVYQHTLDGKLLSEFDCCNSAAATINGSPSSLYSAARDRKPYKGYYFSFEKELTFKIKTF